MKRLFPYLKNKFILAGTLVFIYMLFLDDNDVFTIIRMNRKLSELEIKKSEYKEKLSEASYTLESLQYTSEVERFARENKYFKKDDEDVFVIFKE